MIIGIIGIEGSGKTLLMNIIATYLKKYGDYMIMTNQQTYKFKDYDFEKDFLMYREKIIAERKEGKLPKKILLTITEIMQYLDSRESMKKGNISLGKKLLQIRKQGFDMIYDTQLLGGADLRLRKITEFNLMPEFDERTMILKWNQVDMSGRSLNTKSLRITNDSFKLYDTYEDINRGKAIF